MTDKSELKLADGSTDYSQIPSYSSTGPSRRASTRVAHQFRLRVISAPAGQLCKSNQGTCEWYEVVDGERKCGWHGDAPRFAPLIASLTTARARPGELSLQTG